ncbi:hypothetical protein B5S30_g2989 [[Candida] boidinii]|nr:hypothetical protein B5S30_g2989 [[Candida] boidinii]
MSTSIPFPKVEAGKFKYKAVVYTNYGTPLTYQEVAFDLPDPTDPTKFVKDDEILIKVKAASINPVDLILHQFTLKFIKRGQLKGFGGDVSGDVLQVGSAIKDYKVGDRIVADILDLVGPNGSFGEYAVINMKTYTLLSKIPDGMTYQQAAALPIVSGTSFCLLEDSGIDLKGKNVLILGGGSSVGTSGIMFAKYFFGAKNVIATCSPRSSEKTLKAGADKVVDYSKGSKHEFDEVVSIVKEIGKFDFILDTIRDTVFLNDLNKVLKTAKEGGKYSVVAGSASLNYEKVSVLDFLPSRALLKNAVGYKLGLCKYNVATESLHKNENWGPAIKKLFEEGHFNANIDSVFTVDELDKNIKKVASGASKGKVVCSFE